MNPPTQTPRYEYAALTGHDFIRILEVQPGAAGSLLKCTLIHATLSACAKDIYDQYIALSYVWGDPHNTTVVSVHACQFAVTVNLAAALNALRHITKPLKIWADAICINQEDVVERNHQVSLMI